MNDQTLAHLNRFAVDKAREHFRRACGSDWWCDQMTAARPFGSVAELAATAEAAFDRMPRAAWLEAFACHPRIGDLQSLRMRFAGNREWSSGEQDGVARADEQTLVRLADQNEAYYQRFGWIFIVCATGKSAQEMLTLLESRIGNDAEAELKVAAAEQRKITWLRLEKLEIEDPH